MCGGNPKRQSVAMEMAMPRAKNGGGGAADITANALDSLDQFVLVVINSTAHCGDCAVRPAVRTFWMWIGCIVEAGIQICPMKKIKTDFRGHIFCVHPH